MKQQDQIGFEESMNGMDNKRNSEKQRDILDILLDQDNKDHIILTDESGKTLAFEQVAIIPYGSDDNKVLYAILKPITEIKGVADDEAIVFKVDEDVFGNTVLRFEDDELIAIDIFNKYHDMLE